MMNKASIENSFNIALENYEQYGVDVNDALKKLEEVSISIHCWQGDDVAGFEKAGADLGGGLAVTGNYPGKARSIDELQKDLGFALSLIPGKHRINLHAIYGDYTNFKKDRDQLTFEQFKIWADWALTKGVAIDFNATCFAHEKAADGWTLCSLDENKRRFWVDHLKRCREIGESFGKKQKSPCVHNLWIPDGCKDVTVNRLKRRDTLKKSLNEIYSVRHDCKLLADSVESKLFGIGSESFVAGSHDFYMQWATTHNISENDNVMLCLDMGHFHQGESVADKISSLKLFQRNLLLHISRGIRWDSDHVAIFDDALRELMLELSRTGFLDKTFIALDYFDASINRIGAWVTGARSTLMALLFALLEPLDLISRCELEGNGFKALALKETAKALPFGAVWNYWCLTHGISAGADWIEDIKQYEKDELSKRF